MRDAAAGDAATAGASLGLTPGADPAPAHDEPRDADLILARVHLLLGSLGLARAELETLAGRGALDDDAIRDLAEARWRTGDLSGAGEAASAWLETHPDDILGLVIAAEAQSALGRPGEARRLAGRAMERADGSLDPVFAGMQRATIWPVDPDTASGPVGVLFDDLHPGPLAVRPLPVAPRSSGIGRAGDLDPAGSESTVPAAAGPSLWGEDTAGLTADDEESLDPTVLFHRARIALETGQAGEAATGLILALRASPGLAPAILDLLSGRSESILALVRGDAQRVVGREVEAMRDHAVAAGALAPAVTSAGGPSTGSAPDPGLDPDPDQDPQPEPPPDLEDS